jgi:hypothetical protein
VRRHDVGGTPRGFLGALTVPRRQKGLEAYFVGTEMHWLHPEGPKPGQLSGAGLATDAMCRLTGCDGDGLERGRALAERQD